MIIFLRKKRGGGEGWLGFLGLGSGQEPWWNWYLSSVVNFGEVRRGELAKSTLLTSSLVPLGSFQIFYGLFRCQRESGVRKATGSYRIYFSLVKLQPTFLSFQWKTCLWAEHWWWWWRENKKRNWKRSNTWDTVTVNDESIHVTGVMGGDVPPKKWKVLENTEYQKSIQQL